MKTYGTFLVEGDFGAGKSFWLTNFCYNLKKQGAIIIYNQPYPWVDLFYSSVDDLNKVIDMLNSYMQATNNPPSLYYPPIVFAIDEAHNYFFSRNFTKNFDDKRRILFTQPRKRNILIPVVSQRFNFLDINIRRLLFEIISPRTTLLGWLHYIREVEVLDIENPNLWVPEYEGKTWKYVNWLITDLFQSARFFHSDIIPEKIYRYKYLTNYVIGNKSYVDSFKIKKFENFLLDRFKKFIENKKNNKEYKRMDWSFSPLNINNWLLNENDLKNFSKSL